MASIAHTRIRNLAREIGRQFAPQRIVMFGSQALGTASRNSDVDLLVIMKHRGASARMAAEILNRVAPDFSVDLIVRTPREVRRRIVQKDRFLAEALRQGKVLYESAHA